MGWRDWGNPPLYSAGGSTSDPSTSTIIAEVSGLQDRLYEVRWVLGASTGAIWRVEHTLSTGLGSTAIRHQTIIFTGSNQSAEYVMAYKAETGDRFRALLVSTITATVAADIQAEALT